MGEEKLGGRKEGQELNMEKTAGGRRENTKKVREKQG